MPKPKVDIYERITAHIIAELEKGNVPWLDPWNRAKASRHGTQPVTVYWPQNAITHRWYSGYNVMACWIHAATLGKSGEPLLFLTYKQAEEHGGFVRKGEKSCEVVGWARGTNLTENDDGDMIAKKWFAPFGYRVFHVSQCDNVKLPKQRNVDTSPALGIEDEPKWQCFVKATGADIRHGGGQCFYTPDYIQMAAFTHFHEREGYKATLCHELAHWTGHEKRLNRELKNRKGSHAYAFEELIAELSSAFLCAKLGIPRKVVHHAGYIKMWLGAAKFDKKFVVMASSKAAKATDYIMDLVTEPLKKHGRPKVKRVKSKKARQHAVRSRQLARDLTVRTRRHSNAAAIAGTGRDSATKYN